MFYIYKIKGCNYIGSTGNLEKRLERHIVSCWLGIGSVKYNYKVYKYIRNNNIKIELEVIETYNVNCSNKLQRLVEQYYIDMYNSINNGLNTLRAYSNLKKMKKVWAKKYNQSEHGKLKNRQWQINYSQIENARKREKMECPICKKILSRGSIYLHNKRYH